LENHKLIINSVTIHDVGWYICVAPGIPNDVMAEARLDLEKKIGMSKYSNIMFIKYNIYYDDANRYITK
jgi:hypothetical protein